MKPRLTILLDLDGVLANFHQGVCDLFGVDLDKSTLPLPWPYAIQDNIADVLGKKVTSEELWNAINLNAKTAGFWANLEPYDYHYKLIQMINSFGLRYRVDVIISTSPGYYHAAHSQKVQWVEKNTPYHPRMIMIGSHKHLMAKPETFLIDDCDHNVDKFRENDGNAFLWPQRWNKAASKSLGETGYLIAIADLNAALIRWALPFIKPQPQHAQHAQ